MEAAAHPSLGYHISEAVGGPRVPRVTYDRISALLTLAGTATALAGIMGGEGKPIGIGLVLILGGFVFAFLHVANRRRPDRGPLGPGAGGSAPPSPLTPG